MLNTTMFKRALLAASVATGLAFAGGASATSFPSGDWTAKGVLTITNSATPPGVFICKVTMFGRANGQPGTGGDGTGVITGVRIQNTQYAPQPLPGQLCGGIPGVYDGARAKFPNPGLHWPYVIDPIAGTITIDNVWFGVDPNAGARGCGDPKTLSGQPNGTIVAAWTNGDPTFADGDVTWAHIGPGQLTSPGGYNCDIDGVLKLYFKVGHEVIAK